MEITEQTKIGSLVAYDYRIAWVFDYYDIDFASKGRGSISEVCESSHVLINLLMKDLKKALENDGDKYTNFNYWPIDLLTDYIEKRHHRYAFEKIPIIKNELYISSDLCSKEHPELIRVNELFNEAAQELTKPMQKEEELLFPHIRKMALAKQENKRIEDARLSSIENPVKTFLLDHELETSRFKQITGLADKI